MKALILAAGFGSRLAPTTDTLPKALVPVNGTPILFKQIKNLHENGIFDITIVSGYKADVLKDAVLSLWPEIKIVESVDYATTNNMYSAYLGIQSIGGIGMNDMLMMNADVFYDSSVITALIDCRYENAIVTDIGKHNDESMKVVEIDGRLTEISKTISKDRALGCSIDVYKFSGKAVSAFYNKCKEYIVDKKQLKKWSEVALNDILYHVEFHACPLVGRWFEIDNHDDLNAAEQLFKD